MKSIGKRKWTPYDNRRLMEMIKEGALIEEIAEELKRSYSSVKLQARRRGYKFKVGRRINPLLRARIVRLFEQGFSVRGAAKVMGKPYPTVQNTVRRMLRDGLLIRIGYTGPESSRRTQYIPVKEELGMIVKCECGAELRIAGGYARRAGTRPSDKKGTESSDGKAAWGRHVCHFCGRVVTIPEAGEEDGNERRAS